MRHLKSGVTVHKTGKTSPGFTLFSPLYQRKTYIINMSGEVVHEWDLPGHPGDYAYLLPNGNLLAATLDGDGPEGLFARGGLIQELDWSGNLIWEYRDPYQHHDFRRLPNGNLIYPGWELLPDAVAARIKGGIPGSEHGAGMWGDYIREVDATGETQWEWHAHENMKLENYPLPSFWDRREFAHANTVFPIGDDRVLICFRVISLMAIVERRSGKIIWERREPDWGGPHDLQLLDNGNMMVFANRGFTPSERGSAVIEFDPDGGNIIWEYEGTPNYTFDSPFISGCQRLLNGNTLICEGIWGRLFEVTPAGEIVWEYVSPYLIDLPESGRLHGANFIFRAYRYAPGSPEIADRLDR